MKITKEYLRGLIKKEMGISEMERIHEIKEISSEPVLKVEGDFLESFETVKDHTLLSEAEKNIEELKSITNEIKKMKQLVDFRNPLLSEEDFSNL